MRRILVLLSVVALMVVMLAMAVAPAFAKPPTYTCTLGSKILSGLDHKFAHELERSGETCVKEPKT
jgi:hypothetical protein